MNRVGGKSFVIVIDLGECMTDKQTQVEKVYTSIESIIVVGDCSFPLICKLPNMYIVIYRTFILKSANNM